MLPLVHDVRPGFFERLIVGPVVVLDPATGDHGTRATFAFPAMDKRRALVCFSILHHWVERCGINSRPPDESWQRRAVLH
jgi:hypothetical protein